MARSEVPLTRFYQIRAGHWGWARFWVTDDGCLAIMSDWGNYGYWWGSPGYEFRHFLCNVNDDYLLSKLCSGRSDVIYDQETERRIKDRILELRRAKSIDSHQAQEEWSLVNDSSFDNEIGAHDWYLNTELEDAHDLLVYGHPPQAKAFVKHCWLLFTVELRHDIGEPLRAKAAEWFRRAA